MRRLLHWPELVPAVLLVVAFIGGALASRFFLDANYLLDRTTIYAEIGLMVVGMTFVIICGQIDLSVASTLALVACVTAKIAVHQSIGVAIVVGLGLGAALGAINGALVAYAKMPSFLVTLATLALYRGIAQALLGSESIPLPPKFTGVHEVYLPYPIPVMLVLVVLVAVILGLVLHRSVFGRWLYATGSNEQAAEFGAVPVARVKFTVFVLSGLLAGIGGILMDSRLGVARFDHAKGFELDVITATVLGGTSIYGGKGSMLGALLAFFLIFFVRTGLGLANVTAEYQLTAVGTLLVFAVAANTFVERRARALAT
jgi:rhamnose transport system permease protein